jgi:histidinol-phosphate aminotransferase
VRPNIATLQPYRCARDDYSEGILLDANENSLGACVAMDTLELNRYPCPHQHHLKDLIATFRGVERDQVFLGVGSDEAIDVLLRIFCVPARDAVIVTPPTYGMYAVSAKINDVAVQEANLTRDFDVDEDLVLGTVTPATKVLFLCSPGNPTAKSVPLEVVERLCDAFDGIVVVDEAYVDFSDTPSACGLLGKHDNLVLLQTLSKGFGLAGIRLGMAFGSPQIISLMNACKAPYNVSKLTARVATQAFEAAPPVLASHVAMLRTERDRLAAALAALPTLVARVWPSDANFLLFQVDAGINAEELHRAMAANGVVCRFRGREPHCANCIRVTAGTPTENDRFLAVFEATAEALLGPRPYSATLLDSFAVRLG